MLINRGSFRGFLEQLAVRLGYYNNAKFTAEYAKNPIYLVEYPKSGVTFLSCLLANYYAEDEVNYFNVHQFVGDLHIGKLNNSATGRYNFYKTHAEVNTNFHYVIHLARNPHDTLVSYFNYYTSRAVYAGSFQEFLLSPRGMTRYRRHINGWINCYKDTRYFPISYERLCAEPSVFLMRWCELNGETLDEARLGKALSASSKDSMVKQEIAYKGGGRSFESFVGEKKFKAAHMTKTDHELIEKNCSEIFHDFMDIENRFYAL